jgi:two-component system, LytTR family, response regulator
MNRLYKTILIDDEPGARRSMRNLLSEYNDTIEIIAEAGSGIQALELIESLKPDLIFLDIQMPDLTGFEVIEKLQHKPYIIFTTAYEQYAIKAFESFSIDYLLKPIKDERLHQSIQKLKHLSNTQLQPSVPDLQEIIKQLKAPAKATALPIKTGDKIILLRFESMSYLEAADKYVFVYNDEGQKFITDFTLNNLEEKLPDQFIRIQKSLIINKEKIKEIHRHYNGRFMFCMDDKPANKLVSGPKFYDSIKEVFGL